MLRSILSFAFLTAALAGFAVPGQAQEKGLDAIQTVVVIYAENRSFDNLYGLFPGANGLQNVKPEQATQLDRDGTPLKELPPVWGNLTGKGVTPVVTQAQTEHLRNKPFAIDDP
ncbi:MAG TPA: alkaline phosphatase family protein, partial [Pseudolabrys sp.]